MSEEIDIQLELHPQEVNRLLRQVEAGSPALEGELLRGALENAFAGAPDTLTRVSIHINTSTEGACHG
ncbi:MAG: hypothetical protein EPO32_06090 [Anaerolineae bacterium]|nr:MAG: hypothetical protein EPO32_06090 [Anaerolineae bacterium]